MQLFSFWSHFDVFVFLLLNVGTYILSLLGKVRIGLAADIGTLQRLPKIVGYGSRVKELCYTGEDFYADEARSIGFISRISESDSLLFPLAMQICQNISRNSPVAVSGTKMSLN